MSKEKKLSKDELIQQDELIQWFHFFSGAGTTLEDWQIGDAKRERQAEKQILHLIESSAQAKEAKEKPGDREEWIAERLCELFNLLDPPKDKRIAVEDWLRTLLNEAPKPKVKVSRVELSDLASDILGSITTSRVMGCIEVFLKSKNVEITE